MKVKLWGWGIIAAMPILSLMAANPSIATTFELTPLPKSRMV
jgi:hypothetical protein